MLPPPGISLSTSAGAVAIGVDIPTSPVLIAMTTATALSSSVVAALTSTPAAAATGQPAAADMAPAILGDAEGECQLLGSFALVVQGALGGLALLALVFKRWRERPQRPVKIWFFDVSKQVFGSVLVHVVNIFMSMLTSGNFSIKLGPNATQSRMMSREAATAEAKPYEPNPCSFYLLNLAIDTTIGIPILIVLIRLTTAVVRFTPLGKPAESIQSGHYGNPPNARWWLKQSVIYFFCLFGMKLCVLVVFLMMPWISAVGDWALSWTAGNERLQIAFVMMIFPLIMNGLQYYIIDSFIKKRETDHEMLPSEDPDRRSRHRRPGRYDDDAFRTSDDLSVDSDSDSDWDQPRPKFAKPAQDGRDGEYDPERDGTAPTIVGSGGSGSNRNSPPGKTITPELFPKE